MSIFFPNNAGTVRFNAGSATINGTGTLFKNYRAGSTIAIPGVGSMQLSADPTSDTMATGSVVWGGATTAFRAFEYHARNEEGVFSDTFVQLLNAMRSGNLPSLAALNGLGGDLGVMLTGAGTGGTFPLTVAGRALAGAADAAAQRTALEVRKAGAGGTLDAINVLGAIQQAGVDLKAIRSISQDVNSSIFTTTSTSLVGSAGSFKNASGLTSSLLALSVLDVEARRTGVGGLGMYASLYRYTGSAYAPVTGAFGGQMLQTGFSLGSGTNIYRSTIVLSAILTAADKRSDGNAWSLNPYFASYYAGCTAQITKHSHIMVEFEP